MFGLLGKIFGSERVIQSGIELIDSFHTSKEEEIEVKTRSKVALLEAYAPFKLAQRVIAFSFTFIYLSCFALVLGFTLMDQTADADKVKAVLEDFQIGYAMLIILAFYFGGGAAEGILQNRQRRNP
jgi:hypothetical protein